MSKAAISIMAYGIYALGAGVTFLLVPNMALPIYGMEPAADHWITTVAILTLGLAYYYITAARTENRGFFHMSWKGRTWFFTATLATVLLGKAPVGMLLVGSTDLIMALWTVWAIRQDERTS
ncbi:hypothetical protein [Oricola sp.]|uniref:hypothetical protein n=1 Tax=Oricola sp. TaxID=1979950 RepID=UPI003BA88051